MGLAGRKSPSVLVDEQPKKRGRGRPPRDATVPVEATRDRLLDAAIDLFSRYGYDPVSTGAVADAAGLTQSMVHYHFGSKDALWRAAIDRLMRRRGRAFPVSRLELRDVDPVTRLKILIRRLIEANAAEPNYVRIVLHEAMANTPRLDWLMERYIADGFAAFNSAIRDAIDAGLIRPLPLHDITSIATSVSFLTFSIGEVTRRVYDTDLTSDEHVQSLSDSIITTLFAGLQIKRD